MTRQGQHPSMTDRSLRQCREALGLSQSAFARQLGVAPESYRPWDAGRRPVPSAILARARALVAHRDAHPLSPLPLLATLVGVHVRTLRNAARDGRLPVTYYDLRCRALMNRGYP